MSFDFTNAWYGNVNEQGQMQSPGTQNWESKLRAPGRTKITLRGHADFQPSIQITPLSNNLDSPSGGAQFVQVSDIGRDEEGNWFFGVVTHTRRGIKAQSFSFMATATNSNVNQQ